MRARVISEHGYEEAMLGISLSWASSVERSKKIAEKLAHKQGGHNKFLESIIVWMDVTAPRYWWQEFDTYRVGVTKQSESTMHTICKSELSVESFEGFVSPYHINHLNELIARYKETELKDRKEAYFISIKQNLPEGFLQRRIVCLNYKALQNMHGQRMHHRLPEWKIFFNVSLEHPEFIWRKDDN
jgi:hypothetical protein